MFSKDADFWGNSQNRRLKMSLTAVPLTDSL